MKIPSSLRELSPDLKVDFFKNFLLVDNDVVDLFITEKALRSVFEIDSIHITESGESALEILLNPSKQKKIDLILVDLNMPHMDGFELIERIKAIEFKFSSPFKIIMLTSSIYWKDIERTKQMEVSYLEKPLTGEKLLTIFSAL